MCKLSLNTTDFQNKRRSQGKIDITHRTKDDSKYLTKNNTRQNTMEY